MRHILFAAAVAALATPAIADAKGFHIDQIIPGEGAESDCFRAYQRIGDKPPPGKSDVLDIFEDVGETGFIKIDGKVHTLHQTSDPNATGHATYAGDGITAEESYRITRVDRNPDEGDTYHLKGHLKVTYGGEIQSVAVIGTDFCYSGGG